MSVYVDDARIPHKGKPWYHLMADTEAELHLFARKIRLRREWLHGDHFDLTEAMRTKAIGAGAKEVTAEEMAEIRRKLRKAAKV